MNNEISDDAIKSAGFVHDINVADISIDPEITEITDEDINFTEFTESRYVFYFNLLYTGYTEYTGCRKAGELLFLAATL